MLRLGIRCCALGQIWVVGRVEWEMGVDLVLLDMSGFWNISFFGTGNEAWEARGFVGYANWCELSAIYCRAG